MNQWQRVAVMAGSAWVGFASVVLISCSSVTRTVMAPPEIPDAEFVGNQACAQCHAEINDLFPGSPHARVHLDTARLPGGTGCESCHGPGGKHIEFGGAREWIVNPGRDPMACLDCHVQTHAEFHLPFRHPVLEGPMNCVECHDPHGFDIRGPAGAPAMSRLDESCAGCHRDQARQFVFEHGAMREGCVTCHNPHGSIHSKMLVQPDSNLCMRCHSQVHGPGVPPGRIFIGRTDHTEFMRMGHCWSCHTAVHGSNIDQRLRF